MVKTLSGPELLRLYKQQKYLSRLVMWNPEYVKYRKKKWLNNPMPPTDPLELVKAYSIKNKNNDELYILRMLCSDKTCGCHGKDPKHPWVLCKDGSEYMDPDNKSPVLAKFGAFIIHP